MATVPLVKGRDPNAPYSAAQQPDPTIAQPSPDMTPSPDTTPVTPSVAPTQSTTSNEVTIAPPPTTPENTPEYDALRPVAQADPPNGNDNLDAFILSSAQNDKTKQSDEALNRLLGANKPVIPPPPPEAPFTHGGRIFSEMVWKAPVKGVRDAVQETTNLLMDMGNKLSSMSDGTILDFMGRPVYKDGQWFPDVTADVKINLPDVGEVTTTPGIIEKNIVQFVTGMALAGKVLKAAGVAQKVGTVANTGLKSFLGAFAAFDGHEQRLSDWLTQVNSPILNNAVTQYLASNKDDTEITGRIKNGLENAGFGYLADGVLMGLRSLRAATKAKDAVGAKTFEEAAVKFQSGEGSTAQLTEAAAPVDKIDKLLGDPTEATIIRHEPGVLPPDAKPGDVVASTTDKMTVTGQVSKTVESAAALEEKGLTKASYGNQEIFINFNKIETPEDLTKVIDDMKANKPAPMEPAVKPPLGIKFAAFAKYAVDQAEKAKRGIVEPTAPQTLVPPMESVVAGSERTWELLINSREARAKSGQAVPLAADNQEALKSLWVGAQNKLSEVIQLARNAPTPENLFAFRKMLNTFGIINNELMGIRSATNKAANIWRKPDQIPMRRMQNIEETLNRTGGIEDNKKLLDQLARHLDSDPNAALGLAKMAEASRKYGTVRAIRNFWTLGLLTNWKTHEVNAISNTFMMFQLAAERAAASRYSAVMGMQDGVAPGEASSMLYGMWNSLGDAFRNAGRTFRTGQGGGSFQKMEQPFSHEVFENPDTSLKKFINTSMWYWGGIGRALQASDEFFKTLNYSAAVEAEILRKAYHEVQSGTLVEGKLAQRITELRNDTPEDILLRGEDLARYATFTREPGKITKAISRAMNVIPGARYMVPFINTPSNLFNASIERTPFAVFQKQFRDAVRRGGADEAIAMTRLTMGMSMMAMAMNKGFDGQVTGSGPPFWSKEYAQWKATGKQPYAFKKGDKWIPYNRFDPQGMVFGFGADLAEKLQHMDENSGDSLRDYQDLFAGVTFSIASQMLNKNYMQGTAALFNALENADMNASQFVSNFAGSLIPSVSGEIARQVDPVQRQSYDFITKWKSRTPFVSETLSPKLDMWAREQKYGTGNHLIDAFNPVNVTTEHIMPIDHEFMLQGWSISKDIHSFDIHNTKIDLRGHPEIKNFMMINERQTPPSRMSSPDDPTVRKLIKKYGDYSMVDLMNMIVTGNHPLYHKYMKGSDGPDGEKVAMLKTIRHDYYEATKAMTMKKFPELQLEIIHKSAERAQQATEIANRRRREAAGSTIP